MSSNILVSPNEPTQLVNAFTPSTSPESYGMDFLLPGRIGLIGVQRKTVADLLSSSSDGRLATQLIKSADLTIKVLIFEGEIKYTIDGYLMDHSFGGRQWHRKSIIKMLLTMRMHGYWIVETRDKQDTIYHLELLHDWANAEKHTTGFSRPSGGKDSFGRSSHEMACTYFLTGFTSIGQGTAEKIYDMFKCVPMTFSRPTQHILQVPGIGKHRFKKMKEILDYKE